MPQLSLLGGCRARGCPWHLSRQHDLSCTNPSAPSGCGSAQYSDLQADSRWIGVDWLWGVHRISATATNLGHPINVLGKHAIDFNRVIDQAVIVAVDYLDERAWSQPKEGASLHQLRYSIRISRSDCFFHLLDRRGSRGSKETITGANRCPASGFRAVHQFIDFGTYDAQPFAVAYLLSKGGRACQQCHQQQTTTSLAPEFEFPMDVHGISIVYSRSLYLYESKAKPGAVLPRLVLCRCARSSSWCGAAGGRKRNRAIRRRLLG